MNSAQFACSSLVLSAAALLAQPGTVVVRNCTVREIRASMFNKACCGTK